MSGAREQNSYGYVPHAGRARLRSAFRAVAAGCLLAPALLFSSCASHARARAADPAAGPQAMQGGGIIPAGFDRAEAQGTDYSRFAHTNPNHSRLPCLLCHRREDAPTKPRLPGHTPCAGCHSQQFARQDHPICTICHTDPAAGAVKSFPRLKSFGVRFDHARHGRGAARPGAGCIACHKPARRGVALSIPAGLGAHATCYQCHTPRARSPRGRDISSCGTCHRIGTHSRAPISAQAYRVGFDHARHTRKGLGCAECHDVRAGAPRGRQVTSPQPLMHHASGRAQSCMTCHDNRRAFGGEDFSDCLKCHQGGRWAF